MYIFFCASTLAKVINIHFSENSATSMSNTILITFLSNMPLTTLSRANDSELSFYMSHAQLISTFHLMSIE